MRKKTENDPEACVREMEQIGWIEQDFEFTSARSIVINFLEAILNSGNLSRIEDQREDFTIALADHLPPAADAAAWERISGLAEEMLDERLALLASDLPEALIGIRMSLTQH
jgi:hypothetical protein